MFDEAAAYFAVAVLLGLSIFQLLLVFGRPIGHYAWGGAHKVLPLHLRIASCISIILYIFFSLVILDKSGIISVYPSEHFINISMWVLSGYFALGIGLNAVSRSTSERKIMTPVAALLAIIFTYVSLVT